MSDLTVLQRLLADGWSNSANLLFTVIGGRHEDEQFCDDFPFSDHEYAIGWLADHTDLSESEATRFYDLWDDGEWDDAVRLLAEHDVCLTVGGLILQLNYND